MMFIKTKFISDLQIYLIREQDPETGLSCILKDLSKTGTYKNSALFPSGGTYQSNKKGISNEMPYKMVGQACVMVSSL
ncbi:hypothetical protein [Candidatus Avelusimicrobium alvi]|uniref:hypothetical protein n=1 Tax=Candidatus Avelusimicrobium alvi TaxID=3416221 RepID=UPI003D12B136